MSDIRRFQPEIQHCGDGFGDGEPKCRAINAPHGFGDYVLHCDHVGIVAKLEAKIEHFEKQLKTKQESDAEWRRSGGCD